MAAGFIIFGCLIILLIYIIVRQKNISNSCEDYSNSSISERRNVNLLGDGDYLLEVVGESHYQYQLEKICGGKTGKGHYFHTEAFLISDDNNPYDNNAVRVEIMNGTVGYLSREQAMSLRQNLRNAGYPSFIAKCNALIVGGWDNGAGDTGSFGVKLDVPVKYENDDFDEDDFNEE